jgi:uncharacterized membrane protein
MRKRLSEQQEFEIMRLVLNKFLWVGFVIMAFGMYQMYATSIPVGLMWIVVGAVLLILFMMLIVREYEVLK